LRLDENLRLDGGKQLDARHGCGQNQRFTDGFHLPAYLPRIMGGVELIQAASFPCLFGLQTTLQSAP